MLPGEYIVQKFFQLAGYAKRKHGGRVYEGGCPICREGKSWGKKRRLYFIPGNELIYCHNCGWSGSPVRFVQQVQGLSYKEIISESEEYDYIPEDVSYDKNVSKSTQPVPSLPEDSINILDSTQIDYYKNDKIVNTVYSYAYDRNLVTAVNRPKTLWVSLVDYVHRNRLIFPFYDAENNIVFYQTRTVVDSNKTFPKYLSKMGGEKSIFNINNINSELDVLFIFEGPIDACFVKNGIAVAGIQENSTISLTPLQSSQLSKLNLFTKIWVLDSQWLDTASKKKTYSLIKQGWRVFVWPERYGRVFKDFNDMSVALNINEIPYKFILDNTYTGLKAEVLLNMT